MVSSYFSTAMQICSDSSEAQELFEPQGLFLKPVAKLSICVQLPQLKTPGKSISNWEVMEKIKNIIKPDQFIQLKVSKSTLEFIRFEGESENKVQLKTIISRLDNKTIKLSGFPDLLKVRAAEAKVVFPTRHDWDSYFRDAKNMNEMKPGERPDTIYFQMLPCRWFANKKDGDLDKPSEYILKKVFETFGEVRTVDVPMLDPYRREVAKTSGTIQTFSFGQDVTFEAYVQFKEYIGFVKAMTALRGMKLMHKAEDGKCYTANVKVDFDRTKHLSDKNIEKRKLDAEKLIKLEKEKEERVRREREEEERKKEEERRRQQEEEFEREKKREEKLRKREERKQQKRLEKLRLEEAQKLAEKKKQEERKKLLIQRKTEAVNLLTALIDRVKVTKQRDELKRRMEALEKEKIKKIEEERQLKEIAQQKLLEEEAKCRKEKEESEQQLHAKLAKEEQMLRERLIRNLQLKQEQEKDKLRKQVAGKTKLKSVLVIKEDNVSSSKLKDANPPKLKSVLVVNR